MKKLLEMLEGISEPKARTTITKLWAANELLKLSHPPPNNIPNALLQLECKGVNGLYQMSQSMDIIARATRANETYKKQQKSEHL